MKVIFKKLRCQIGMFLQESKHVNNYKSKQRKKEMKSGPLDWLWTMRAYLVPPDNQFKGDRVWWWQPLATVRVNIGCQLDWIWNQLSDKTLGTPVRISWRLLSEVGRPILKFRYHTFRRQPDERTYEEKNLCFILACHPVAFLAPMVPFFTDLGTQLLSGFPHELEPSGSPGIPSGA